MTNAPKITPIPTADGVDRKRSTILFLGKPVSQEEYDEICRNLGEFFSLLAEWDKESEQS